jgi:hypothetical protein
MSQKDRGSRRRRLRRQLAAAALAAAALCAVVATAQGDVPFLSPGPVVLIPGNLLISRSDYVAAPALVAGTTDLPPGCGPSNVPADPCTVANTSGGAYPQVFNNDSADPSFGITSPIFLDQVSPYSGHLINTIPVPTSELTTSFSSKSELALNLSTSGRFVTFMGYVAPVDTIDASNANTPGEIDPTNPVTAGYYRAVATLDGSGNFHFTETNAYSGDNGRAAILADGDPGANPVIFAAGNAGNGSNPQPNGVILGAGAQALAPSLGSQAFQSPGTPTPVGSFNITQLPANTKADKIGKDTNFRGLTIYNNVVYYTKGSGSNGINTVYFIDTTGKACPGTGVGLPQPGAPLPSAPIAYNLSTLQTSGLPANMCILKGLPTTLAKSTTESNFPFGLWFANSHTLYVADEGNGTSTYSDGSYTAAASQPNAGLEKWVFNSGLGEWQLAYTLQSGLNLGAPYTPSSNPALGFTWPTGENAATGLPWNPATDGLRNITGRVNLNGTATIWAVTSTVSGNGDQGADPNKVVTVTDPLNAAAPATGESFTTLEAATAGEVLRGVSFTPGTGSITGPLGF